MPSFILYAKAFHLVLGVGCENSVLPFPKVPLCGDKRPSFILLFNHFPPRIHDTAFCQLNHYAWKCINGLEFQDIFLEREMSGEKAIFIQGPLTALWVAVCRDVICTPRKKRM